MSAQPSPQTIVLIHGLWMTPRSWENWAQRYESRGHRVLARSWPGMQGEVEELRRDPSPMRGLGIRQIVDHYDGIIRGLDSPPIIMGHSIGGTVLQLLLDRGLGAAGVGIAPGTVKGVPDLPLSTLRSAFPVLGIRSTATRRRALAQSSSTTPSATRCRGRSRTRCTSATTSPPRTTLSLTSG